MNQNNTTLANILSRISSRPVFGNSPEEAIAIARQPAVINQTARTVAPAPIRVPEKSTMSSFMTDMFDGSEEEPVESKSDDVFSGVADTAPEEDEAQNYSALSRMFSAIINNSKADKAAGIDTSSNTTPKTIREKLQEPRQVAQPRDTKGFVDKVYAAFTHAETGGIEDPFIRTMSKPKGNTSTAYGPAQITGTLANEYRTKRKELFSKDELDYLDRFNKQAEAFKKADSGKLKDKRFGYGGSGVLNTAKDKQLYTSVAKKMLADVSAKNNNNLEHIWKEWRFGVSKKGSDPKYRQKFMMAFNDR